MKYVSVIKFLVACFCISALSSTTCHGSSRGLAACAKVLARAATTHGSVAGVESKVSIAPQRHVAFTTPPTPGAWSEYRYGKAPEGSRPSSAATFIELRTTIINKRLEPLRELCTRDSRVSATSLLKLLRMLDASTTSTEPEDTHFHILLDALRAAKPTGSSGMAFYAELQTELLDLQIKYQPVYGKSVLSLQEQTALDAITDLVNRITKYFEQLREVTDILRKH